MSVVLLGSTSGSVTLQEPAVAGSTVIDLPATSGTMAVLPTATSVLPEASGGTGTTTGYYGFKNRIINGAMVIDQRNAGATVTVTSASSTSVNGYYLDRFYLRAESAAGSKVSVRQMNGVDSTASNYEAGSTPAGFSNSQKITSLSAYTLGASEHFGVIQAIEGNNVADLAWGTASAAPITLSFRVRSSLTGIFGGFISNNGADRAYVFSYTITAANTWETKTITIAGDTSGSWLTNNNVGIYVSFSVGAGSSVTTTAGSWGTTLYRSVTGQTSLVGTSGATFYITGVQLEKGSTATSFDYRPYTTELQLCQRYALSTIPVGLGWGSNKGIAGSVASMSQSTSARVPVFFNFPVQMRATPAITTYNPSAAGSGFRNDSTGADVSETVSVALGATGVGVFTANTASAVNNYFAIHISATAEL